MVANCGAFYALSVFVSSFSAGFCLHGDLRTGVGVFAIQTLNDTVSALMHGRPYNQPDALWVNQLQAGNLSILHNKYQIPFYMVIMAIKYPLSAFLHFFIHNSTFVVLITAFITATRMLQILIVYFITLCQSTILFIEVSIATVLWQYICTRYCH